MRTPPADLSGERDEWQAWLDGDVYGVVVECHHAGTVTWDDDTTTPTEQWREVDAVWGIWTHLRLGTGAQMLQGRATGRRTRHHSALPGPSRAGAFCTSAPQH